MPSKIQWPDAVKALDMAEAHGVEPGPELNAFMKGVDDGYETAGGQLVARIESKADSLLEMSHAAGFFQGLSLGHLARLKAQKAAQ